jgi:outer membrane murein-binding lipoprotein Lpp
MQPLSSFAGAPRRGQRRRWPRVIGAALLLGGLLATMAAAYRVGVAQGRTEVERLKRDVLALREHNRALHERAARADQQAESAIARAARLQREFHEQLPSGEVRQLGDLAAERIRAGVPAGRLAFLLREARPERRCGKEVEARQLPVRTPATTTAVTAVDFASGKILASAEGMTARDAAGTAQPSFDPSQPVTVRFLKIDGEVATAAGRLPLAHAVVLGAEEFQFAIRPADRPDEVRITAQRCASP